MTIRSVRSTIRRATLLVMASPLRNSSRGKCEGCLFEVALYGRHSLVIKFAQTFRPPSLLLAERCMDCCGVSVLPLGFAPEYDTFVAVQGHNNGNGLLNLVRGNSIPWVGRPWSSLLLRDDNGPVSGDY